MKIKTTILSSSFENNFYPRGIAAVECTIQTKDNEVSFIFVRKADENTVEAFVENDNLCQKLAFQKTIKILKYIENYSFEESNYAEGNNENHKNTKFKFDNLYKQKVIELMNLMNWNIDKLSKFVQKYKKKKINELDEKEWMEIYKYLYDYYSEEKDYQKEQQKIATENTEELIKPEEWEEIF